MNFRKMLAKIGAELMLEIKEETQELLELMDK
ncbi:MAG: hypothetical protein ACI848_000037 [Roseivirga sp.]